MGDAVFCSRKWQKNKNITPSLSIVIQGVFLSLPSLLSCSFVVQNFHCFTSEKKHHEIDFSFLCTEGADELREWHRKKVQWNGKFKCHYIKSGEEVYKFIYFYNVNLRLTSNDCHLFNKLM